MRDQVKINNFRRFNDHITTSGQPDEDQLKRLADIGVAHIINLALHTHEDALPDERASVEALGMEYIHIPVAFDTPTEAHFRRFCEAMQRIGNARVHIHCMVNARVTAFLYRYQRDVVHADADAARAMMLSIWQPGGKWAQFIGDSARADQPQGCPLGCDDWASGL